MGCKSSKLYVAGSDVVSEISSVSEISERWTANSQISQGPSLTWTSSTAHVSTESDEKAQEIAEFQEIAEVSEKVAKAEESHEAEAAAEVDTATFIETFVQEELSEDTRLPVNKFRPQYPQRELELEARDVQQVESDEDDDSSSCSSLEEVENLTDWCSDSIPTKPNPPNPLGRRKPMKEKRDFSDSESELEEEEEPNVSEWLLDSSIDDNPVEQHSPKKTAAIRSRVDTKVRPILIAPGQSPFRFVASPKSEGVYSEIVSGKPMDKQQNQQQPLTPVTGNHVKGNTAIRDTKIVKRKKAELPKGTLPHPVPKFGDWLNSRRMINNYIILESLGSGSYAEVKLVKEKKSDRLYAMKFINRDMMKPQSKTLSKQPNAVFEDIKREIEIMKKLNHPNVLGLFEVLDDPKQNKLYLVLEYMRQGDLLTNQRGKSSSVDNPHAFAPMEEQELHSVLIQVLLGLSYLHEQKIVHGDLKPQNLLLGENGIVKIADFGISKMTTNSSQKLTESMGTPAFMSPEMVSGEEYSGPQADVWALGVTLYFLKFAGQTPFKAKTALDMFDRIVHDPVTFPTDHPCDAQLLDLMKRMLLKNPLERLTVVQVMQHPWVSKLNDISVKPHVKPQHPPTLTLDETKYRSAVFASRPFSFSSLPSSDELKPDHSSGEEEEDEEDDEEDEVTTPTLDEMFLTLIPSGSSNVPQPDESVNVNDRSSSSSLAPEEGPFGNIGLCSSQGLRSTQEDRWTIIPDFLPQDEGATTREAWTFVAVFDGHGGAFSASYCRDHFHEYLRDLRSSLDITKVFHEACEALDNALCPRLLDLHDHSGSTATFCLISSTEVVCGHLGDCRALLGSIREDEDTQYQVLTRDHKPTVEEERAYIRREGGSIVNGRINGILNISRSFGDLEFKGIAHRPSVAIPQGYEIEHVGKLIHVTPDVVTVQRRRHQQGLEDFLLLACDGLWEVFSNDQVMASVRRKITRGDNYQRVAEELVQEAIAHASTDNVTVILIQLKT